VGRAWHGHLHRHYPRCGTRGQMYLIIETPLIESTSLITLRLASVFDTKPDLVYVTYCDVASVIHLSLLPTSFHSPHCTPVVS
jgi:hypothetical protein